MSEQNPRISPWLIAGRVIFTLALIGCIAFIFSNSMQIGVVSEGVLAHSGWFAHGPDG